MPFSEDGKTILIELKVALARVEERQEHSAHRARNLEQKFGALATKRDLEPLAARIDSLESTRTWIGRSLVGAVMTAFGGLVAVSKSGHP